MGAPQIMAYPPLPDDLRQQLQSKLPFQQESGRVSQAPIDMTMAPAPSVMMPGAFTTAVPMQSQAAFANASEQEFHERLRRSAKNIETLIQSKAEDVHSRVRKEMMILGGVIALVLLFLTWRSFRTP